MEYEARRQLFINEIAHPDCHQKLTAFEAAFSEREEAWTEQFLQSFESLCRRIKAKQDQGEKGPIGHITYSMLRTEIAVGRGRYLVEATDENWYMDTEAIVSDYDANWAFQPLHELEQELVAQARKYVGENAQPEVEKIKRDYAGKFHAYVVELIRRAMPQAVTLTAFSELEKHETLEIRVGEYLDISEVVYKVDTREKDSASVKAWFEEKRDAAYSYEVFQELDLAECDFQSLNVSYSRFEHCQLANSLWNGSILLGTKLTNCGLEKAQFGECLLLEADFSGSDLRDALFCGSVAKSGLPIEGQWERPGLKPASFVDADLTGADFSYATMSGAVFIGAKLDEVVFTETELDGAQFLRSDYFKLSLSKQQRKSIVWVEQEGVNHESISAFTR